MGHWNERIVYRENGTVRIQEVFYNDDGSLYAYGDPFWWDLIRHPSRIIRALRAPWLSWRDFDGPLYMDELF